MKWPGKNCPAAENNVCKSIEYQTSLRKIDGTAAYRCSGFDPGIDGISSRFQLRSSDFTFASPGVAGSGPGLRRGGSRGHTVRSGSVFPARPGRYEPGLVWTV